MAELATYVDDAIVQLGCRFRTPHPLAIVLQQWTTEIAKLQTGTALDLQPADYFYHLHVLDPIKTAVHNKKVTRNLAILSQALNTFQIYYYYTVATHRNRKILRIHLDRTIRRIRAREFAVRTTSEATICKECDFRM